MKSLHDFILRKLRSVNGYIDPSDSLVFLSIFECQKVNNFTGGLAEIGVYLGRSFFLMRKLAEPQQVLGIDLFDIKRVPGTRLNQYNQFLENGKRLGLEVDERFVISGDSTKLNKSDVEEKVGEVRFFSVDGGHMLPHFEADSRLSKETLAKWGVIAFDDSFNPEWPEVTFGLVDFIRANAQEFSIFCITNKKTYVCRNEYLDVYRSAIRSSQHLSAFAIADVSVLGTKAVRVHHPSIRRAVYEGLNRVGLGALSSHVYRSSS
jgi:hypothetical protein